jgi:hypothetical protein
MPWNEVEWTWNGNGKGTEGRWHGMSRTNAIN